jgi:hypothetical protein
MSPGALTRRVLLWSGFLLYSTLVMTVGDTWLVSGTVLQFGAITFRYYDLLTVGSLAIGGLPLLRDAGANEPTVGRTMNRLVLAYLLYEVLLVIPVALWLGAPSGVAGVIRAMGVRFVWLLFPVLFSLGDSERAWKVVGSLTVAASVCVLLWGVYAFATGGGGIYFDGGEARFRILWGGATLLFLWPLALATSGLAEKRHVIPLVVLAFTGLALTNHRTGVIAFVAAGLCAVLLTGKASVVVRWAVPVALVALFAAVAWAFGTFGAFDYTFSRLLDASSGNAADRLSRWILAGDFFLARPFNDYVWSWRYYLVDLPQMYVPHNFLLEIAGYEGVAGLAFYCAMAAGVVKTAARFARRDPITLALVVYLVGYATFCIANANWYAQANMPQLVAAVAALAARSVQMSRGAPVVVDGRADAL